MYCISSNTERSAKWVLARYLHVTHEYSWSQMCQSDIPNLFLSKIRHQSCGVLGVPMPWSRSGAGEGEAVEVDKKPSPLWKKPTSLITAIFNFETKHIRWNILKQSDNPHLSKEYKVQTMRPHNLALLGKERCDGAWTLCHLLASSPRFLFVTRCVPTPAIPLSGARLCTKRGRIKRGGPSRGMKWREGIWRYLKVSEGIWRPCREFQASRNFGVHFTVADESQFVKEGIDVIWGKNLNSTGLALGPWHLDRGLHMTCEEI